MGSGDVRSEELAAAFFNDELEQPGEFAHGLRLAELAELEHRSFHGESLFLGLRFGEPHIPDFRGGEDGGGHHIIALRLPVFGMQDVVHGGMGFRDGHVRQHDAAWPDNVADGVHARHRGFQKVVGFDPAPGIDLDPGGVEPEAVRMRHAAHGDAHRVGLKRARGGRVGHLHERRRADLHGDACPGGRCGGHRAGQFHGDALLFHFALQQAADFLIH